MWVVFIGSVLEFGLLGIIIYKIGHKIYLSCKREEMELKKELEEE